MENQDKSKELIIVGAGGAGNTVLLEKMLDEKCLTMDDIVVVDSVEELNKLREKNGFTVEVVDSLDKSKGLINPSQEKSFLIKNYRMDEIYEPILVDSSIPKVSLRNQRRKNKKKVKYKNKKL